MKMRWTTLRYSEVHSEPSQSLKAVTCFFILDTVNSWKVDVKLGPLHKGHMGQVRWLSDTILTYPPLRRGLREGSFPALESPHPPVMCKYLSAMICL